MIMSGAGWDVSETADGRISITYDPPTHEGCCMVWDYHPLLALAIFEEAALKARAMLARQRLRVPEHISQVAQRVLRALP